MRFISFAWGVQLISYAIKGRCSRLLRFGGSSVQLFGLKQLFGLDIVIDVPGVRFARLGILY